MKQRVIIVLVFILLAACGVERRKISTINPPVVVELKPVENPKVSSNASTSPLITNNAKRVKKASSLKSNKDSVVDSTDVLAMQDAQNTLREGRSLLLGIYLTPSTPSSPDDASTDSTVISQSEFKIDRSVDSKPSAVYRLVIIFVSTFVCSYIVLEVLSLFTSKR